jgi:mRNA-degrading endonuclease YafQ of YafQ-DinJ toxin-antitoxin module
MIAAGEELPACYKKHVLKGERKGQIDVHIEPD